MLFQDAMARALVEAGVDTMFGLIGDGNLFVTDSFRRRPGTRYVGVAHEASAVEAASGYAQVTGRVGVATVTHGPALTNTMTALVDAVRARVPLVLLAGDTRVDDKFHVQNIEQRAVVLAAGAGFEQLRTPSTLAEDLAVAIHRARVERRPVVLNMPVDFQWVSTEHRQVPTRPLPSPAAGPSEAAVDAALGLIVSARRPLILAGRGAVEPETRDALLRLSARIGAPLATTLRARDLFRGERFDLGICGTLAHDVAQKVIDSSDCIVAFGASLNPYTTVNGSLGEGRRVVHVDDDRSALGRFGVPDVAVLSDSGAAARAFLSLLDVADVPPSGFASRELAVELAAARSEELPDRSTESFVDIHTAVRRVDAVVPKHRTVVTDSGRFIFSAWPAVGVEDPRHFVHTGSYGSIGLGMGTALGAAAGRPDQPTLLISGDGGFMMGGLNELSTAIRNGLDLIVLLLNDRAYGAEHVQFLRRDLAPDMSSFDWPDFGPVVDALGGRGFTIRNLDELDKALAHLPHRDRPVVLDVHLDPAQVPSAH